MFLGCPNVNLISKCTWNHDPGSLSPREKGQVCCLPDEGENIHTITLSSSFAANLRPLERPLFSAIDVSEGVVALEFAWETLLEGAMLHAGGLHPQARAKRKLILMV